jgi:DeoR/GlpR family transcriptional regulator of sugar metabolism
MLPKERRDAIKTALQKKGSTTLEALAKDFSISKATIYRDARILEQESALSIRKGTITLEPASMEDNFHFQNFQRTPPQGFSEMDQIASTAVALIDDIDSIFIGESLVCYLLAKKIAEQPHLKMITVVTNNFNVALELSSHTKHLYIIGGELLQNTENLYTGGPKFTTNLSTISVNKAFTSVDGIDINAGYTMQELSQLNILAHLPSFSTKTIFLVASFKFGYRSIHQLAPLDFADVIITDNKISEAMVDTFGHLDRPDLIVAK